VRLILDSKNRNFLLSKIIKQRRNKNSDFSKSQLFGGLRCV